MKNVFEFPILGGIERLRDDDNQALHPTQKPLELIKKLVKVHSNPNDLVLDCFLGSGTTAIACKQLNRRFIGIEISKEYCDIANKRLEQSNLVNEFEKIKEMKESK
jgi:DNA modification methylase